MRSTIGTTVGFGAASALVLALGACAGADLSTGSIAPYEAANGFYPYGYQDTVINADQHKISASGSSTASKTRLEKIALTRAAEIGVEQRKAYFKVSNLTHSVKCTKKQNASAKFSETRASSRPVVTIDVVYADTPVDPEFRDSKSSLAEYKAALEADTAPADPAQSSELSAKCGDA